jgi:hypothetical protein
VRFVLPILFAAAMLPSLVLHPDGAQEYSLGGTAHGPDGQEHPATLWISCRDARSVGVELHFIAPATGFDLANYIGSPDGPHDLQASRLSWTASDRVSSIELRAASWHPHDSPGYLQFNINEEEKPGPLLALLLLIEDGGTFEWLQPAFEDPHQVIVATFKVHGADEHNVQWQLGRCFSLPYSNS